MEISRSLRLPPRALALVAAALSIALLVPAAPPALATTAKESRMLDMVNRVRLDHGAPALQWSRRLERRAERNSKGMARKGRLSHSGTLRDGMAEVVGCGSTLRAILRAFMKSSLHRGIILDPYYREAGVGVARGRGALWVTITFRH